MSWADEIVDGDDLVEKLAMLVTVINERRTVDNLTAISYVNGSNSQLAALWSAINTSCAQTGWLDPWVPYNVNYHLVVGSGGQEKVLNQLLFRTYYGLETTYISGVSGASNNTTFKRQRWRRLSGTASTATTDDQGNAATTGQRAFDTKGNTWRCVSSGNWVRDETAQPDVISNTQLLPNSVSGSTNGVVAGDIITAEVLEERRLYVDLQRVKTTNWNKTSQWVAADHEKWQGGDADVDFATAYANYQADWAEDFAPTASQHQVFSGFTVNPSAPAASRWNVSGARDRKQYLYTMGTNQGSTSPYNRTWVEYLWTTGYSGVSGNFYDHGDGVNGHQMWTETHESAAGTATSLTSPFFGGDPSVYLPVTDDYPGSGSYSKFRGYQVTARMAITRWDVTGGFTVNALGPP